MAGARLRTAADDQRHSPDGARRPRVARYTHNIQHQLTQTQPSNVQLTSRVYVDLYSASSNLPLMRSDMDHTVLPANYTMPAFTPQPQSITALWLVLILPSHGG